VTTAVRVAFLELPQIFFGDISDLLGIEKQANSEFQLNLSFVVLEHLFPDGGDIQIVGSDSLYQQLVVLLRPVEAFLGVEIHVV